ncbi:hypothetical protein C8A05DRAFT_38138 [Staphylotrichum tortipilum]|uniref:Uncharacterized protein n=1 Tax=Staphylotrichum tortipilum TaxID=2831512 RepID=A0AAN6MDQ5_9PEZI|nr:hypothetical protein C8A05DRAFT_38138 [Staphylotrichum longicolle]
MEILVSPRPSAYGDFKDKGFKPSVKPPTEPGKSNDDQNANRTAIRKVIAESLRLIRINAFIDALDDYSAWTIKEEGALTEIVTGGGYWGLEIVSRVQWSDNDVWLSEVDKVFTTIDKICDIRLTRGCSMHVHARPLEGWDMQKVRRLMRAIAVFDHAITAVMPADRKDNPWARSNFHDSIAMTGAPKPDNSGFKKTGTEAHPANVTLKAYFNRVETKTWKPLFQYFDSIKTPGSIGGKMGRDRVSTSKDAKRWTALAVYLVAACLKEDFKPWEPRKVHATLRQFHEFLQRGRKMVGWEHMFSPTEAFPENTSPATPYMAWELQEVKRNLDKAENEQSALEMKMSNSRPNTPTGGGAGERRLSPAPKAVPGSEDGSPRPKVVPGSSDGSPTARAAVTSQQSSATKWPGTPTSNNRPNTPTGSNRPNTPTGTNPPGIPTNAPIRSGRRPDGNSGTGSGNIA